jgi:hypothetical protein
MPWTIYCHIHIDSGRRYIGLTKRTMERRWSDHICAAKRSKGGRWHFPNAIRQYGKNAFSHEVLEVCETLEAANEAEIKWIDHFNSRDPRFGFNLAPGGEHIPHLKKNPWDRPGYREKQSIIMKERWKDPEFRAKISIISKNSQNNPRFMLEAKNPAKRAAHSAKSKELWGDLNFRNKNTKNPIHTCHEASLISENVLGTQPPVPNKLCNKCNEYNDFGKDNHTKDGLKCICKSCEKKNRELNAEKRRLRSKKYRELNKGLISSYQFSYFKKNKIHILNRDRGRRLEINSHTASRKIGLLDMLNKMKEKTPCSICRGFFDRFSIDFYPLEFNRRSIYWLVQHAASKEKILVEINNCKAVCNECYGTAFHSKTG